MDRPCRSRMGRRRIVKFRFVAAVRTQMHREEPARVRRFGLILRLKHNSAGGAVAKTAHRWCGRFPIQDARKRLGANDKCPPVSACTQQCIRGRQPVHEARAYGLEIERGAMGNAEFGLHRNGAAWKGVSGVEVASTRSRSIACGSTWACASAARAALMARSKVISSGEPGDAAAPHRMPVRWTIPHFVRGVDLAC